MSKFAALEEIARGMIESGMAFSQLCNEFVDVPKHKLRDWYRKYSTEEKPEKPILVALDSQQSDTDWVKSSAKQIFHEEFDNTIKLRALETLLKAIALEQKSETDNKKQAPDMQELKEMSDDELNQAFRDLL